MAEMIVFPSKEKFSFRSKLIDALLDVRLTLSVKKITSDFIMKSEFKKILDETKEKISGDDVKKALDDVFEEYFDLNPKAQFQNKTLSVSEMQSLIDDETYHGEEKGRSLVKTDAYHRSGVIDTSQDQGTKAA